MAGIFIDAAALQILTGKCIRSCYDELKLIRATLRKKERQKITIGEYAKYEGIPKAEVLSALRPEKNGN